MFRTDSGVGCLVRLEGFHCLKILPFHPVGFEEVKLKINAVISEVMHLVSVAFPSCVPQISCLVFRFLGR